MKVGFAVAVGFCRKCWEGGECAVLTPSDRRCCFVRRSRSYHADRRTRRAQASRSALDPHLSASLSRPPLPSRRLPFCVPIACPRRSPSLSSAPPATSPHALLARRTLLAPPPLPSPHALARPESGCAALLGERLSHPLFFSTSSSSLFAPPPPIPSRTPPLPPPAQHDSSRSALTPTDPANDFSAARSSGGALAAAVGAGTGGHSPCPSAAPGAPSRVAPSARTNRLSVACPCAPAHGRGGHGGLSGGCPYYLQTLFLLAVVSEGGERNIWILDNGGYRLPFGNAALPHIPRRQLWGWTPNRKKRSQRTRSRVSSRFLTHSSNPSFLPAAAEREGSVATVSVGSGMRRRRAPAAVVPTVVGLGVAEALLAAAAAEPEPGTPASRTFLPSDVDVRNNSCPHHRSPSPAIEQEPASQTIIRTPIGAPVCLVFSATALMMLHACCLGAAFQSLVAAFLAPFLLFFSLKSSRGGSRGTAWTIAGRRSDMRDPKRRKLRR